MKNKTSKNIVNNSFDEREIAVGKVVQQRRPRAENDMFYLMREKKTHKTKTIFKKAHHSKRKDEGKEFG